MTDAFIYHCGDVVGYDLQLSRLYCERCGKVGSPEAFGVVRDQKDSGAAARPRAGAGRRRLESATARTSPRAAALG